MGFKSNLILGLAGLILFASSTLAVQVTVVNNLGGSGACPGGNSLTLFYDGSKQKNVPPGGSATLSGNFGAMPGLGIQINNWYWTSTNLPVQAGSGGKTQNPDNSGAQFTVTDSCQLNHAAAWFGKGIGTWLVAGVSAKKSGSGCTITVSHNGYTDAVTPGCCAPPGIGGKTCQAGTWGKTNSGQRWPPA